MGLPMDDSADIWSGWKLIKPKQAPGGAESRTYNRVQEKLRRQKGVLALLNKDRPELLEGQVKVEISDKEVQRWTSKLTKESTASVYEIRDQINFLVAGLEKGRDELGWIVQPPAPIRLLSRESSPFTIDTFSNLSQFREKENIVNEKILDSTRLKEWSLYEKSDKNAEHTSWGLILYIAMTRDGILSNERLTALSQFSDTLCIDQSLAWITFFDKGPVDAKSEYRHAPWRWILGPEMLALLLMHLRKFGHPNCANKAEAKTFTSRSWTAFCKASKIKKHNLKISLSALETAFAFQYPAYLLGAISGRNTSTSLPEKRWRQLVLGQRTFEDSISAYKENPVVIGDSRLSAPATNTNVDLVVSSKLLKDLRCIVYKARNEKRPTFKEISQLLAASSVKTSSAAPIVHILNLWLIDLHKEKLKQSTLYRYIQAIGEPLFLEVGKSPVSKEHYQELASAYEGVIEAGNSAKSKKYKSVVITRFHRFLVENFDFPNLHIEGGDSVTSISTVDANLISEQEYRHTLAAINNMGSSGMPQICHWIFVLGYRAGLRISEALSIQIRDIQMPSTPWEGSEISLIVRENNYVGLKSYDSRRLLPLHLLLTPSECEGFRKFYLSRRELTKHTGIMLFSLGRDITAPLLDSVVHEIIHDAMRNVTGERSLRFHHLRHSLANNLLFAYHNMPPPWESPTHLHILMKKLGTPDTRSGLYFIAQLLGHASPSVTLKSYIHCLDLIQHNYNLGDFRKTISNDFAIDDPEKKLEPLLPLLDIKPATLRQWNRRHGKHYTTWLQKAFSDVQVGNIDDSHYQNYTEQKVKASPLRSIEQLDLQEIETLLFAKGKSAEELETIFRLEAGSYNCLKKSYIHLLKIPTKKQSHDFRHARPSLYSEKKKLAFHSNDENGMHLSPPRTNRQKSVSENIFHRIKMQINNKESRGIAREQLLFFHKNHRSRDGHIYLPDATESIEFIKWLSQLTRDSVFSVRLRASGCSKLTTDQQLEFWRDGLSECRSSIEVKLDGVNRRSTRAYGTGILKIKSNKKDRNETLRFKDPVKYAESWPVRYALFMGCVLMTGIKRYLNTEASVWACK